MLGQVSSPLAAEQLLERLRDEQENPMVRNVYSCFCLFLHLLLLILLRLLLQVRHEAAEALGDIPGVDMEKEMQR